MLQVFANAALLRLVREKARGDVKMKHVVLIFVVTLIFFVSYLPFTVKYCLALLQVPDRAVGRWFFVLTNFLLYVNSWFNPFAYYLTNRAFRQYVSCVLACRSYRPRRASVVTSTVHENSAAWPAPCADKPRSVSLGVWGRAGGKYSVSASLPAATRPQNATLWRSRGSLLI